MDTGKTNDSTNSKRERNHIADDSVKRARLLKKNADQKEPEITRHKFAKTYAVVPDGGWGWLVAFGGFIITMLLSSLGPCFGILFSRYLLELGASSVVTAWIFNTQLFIWHLMGPLVRPLSAEFGWRPVGLIGVLLCSASIIISAFSPSPGFLFFSFSLLSGVGGGLVVSMCYIIIPQYFDRRRGLANAIMMVGLCMGQILGAPFVRYLQDWQGFLGSTLIFGAIMLNGCIGASFFHPVEWHMKKVKVEGEQMLPELYSNPDVTQKTNNFGKNNVKRRPHSEEIHSDEYFMENSNGLTRAVSIQAIIDVSRVDSNSSKSLNTEITSFKASKAPSSHLNGNKLNEIQENKTYSGTVKLAKILVRVAQSTITDLKILKSRRVLIIALGNMLCMNAYFNFVMMVPFAMQAANFTLQDSAWCITVMGMFNLLSRITISILSDWSRFNMRICCMIGYAVLAFVMFVFPFLRDLRWLVSAMGLFGCGLAATISLLHLVMIRYMGMENLAAVFGSTCLLIGIGFPTFGPLIGFIRDYSSSYAVSMWVLSAMTSVSFVLWLFMPLAVSYDNNNARRENPSETDDSQSVA